MLSQTFINVNWEINRPACFAKQTCPLKYAVQKCASMDIPTCWNWFTEVLNSGVRRSTCNPVVLLMNNDPGHFEAFQRENVVVRYFTPNVTSWKQQCELGVIAAVKKRNKCLLVKDVLSFDQLDSDNQQLLKQEGYKFHRGYVSVRYGRPATLLDAANYAKEEWDKATDETIKDAFIKADLRISSDSAVTEPFDYNKPLNIFKSFNITATA